MIFYSRNNYATFKEIKTKTITVQGSRGDSKKAKLFITLSRSEDFFENMKKFNDIREENEKLQGKPSEPETNETEKKWGSSLQDNQELVTQFLTDSLWGLLNTLFGTNVGDSLS